MNKRQRKKQLKKINAYVSNAELWNLDSTICNWMIPRLKQFKRLNIAYPGIEPMNTPEKWDEAIDKMIRAFELARFEPIDLDDNLELRDDYEYDIEKYKIIYEKWDTEVQEGLQLFVKWFSYLWI